MIWLVFIVCSLFDFSHAYERMCPKCLWRGSCDYFWKSVLEDPCICDEYYLYGDRGRFKYGGRDCSVYRKCWNDMDCYAGECNDFGLCECDNGWEGNQCNYEERCPPDQCSGHGKCMNTHRFLKSVPRNIAGYWINYGKIYSRVEHACECNDGFTGYNCEIALSSQCNNHGTFTNGQCICVDGFSGTHCELCEKCNFGGTCGNSGTRDNEDGVCNCNSGYMGSSCECLDNQCGVGGTCQSDGSCKCDPGYLGSDCSGHGTCDDSGCTCDYGFEGENCNICNNCETYYGEHARKTGIFLTKEDFVVRLEEKPSVHFYRDYNKAPWQAVKIPEANTVEKCYDECMSLGNHASARKSTTDGYVVKRWADRLDWDESVILDKLPNYKPYEHRYSRCVWTGSAYSCPDFGSEEITEYYLGNSSLAYYRKDGGTMLANLNNDVGHEYPGMRLMRDFSLNPFTRSLGMCDDFALCYKDMSETKCLRFCAKTFRDTEDIPPAPLYDYIMRNFWNKYDIDDVTHFEFLGDDCLCYTGKETDVGSQKTLLFDARTSAWDTMWSGSEEVKWGTNDLTIFQTSNYEKVMKRESYFVHRDAEYVVPCNSSEHSVGTHCCLEGMGPSRPGALDCDKNIACNPNPCSADVNGNPVQCIDSDNANDFTGPIDKGQFVCQCQKRATGNDCELPCCERGDPVPDVFPSATVHGECDYGVGGCKCDYGYYGYDCQCTDSMCGYGFCNRALEEEESVTAGNMCTCHPGYELDGDGVCSININDCTPSTCQNGGVCVDLADAYHCECPLGYVGEHCEQATGWDQGSISCGVNQYLVSGRCIDCPFGTYSLAGSTTCRVELTDDNIHNAVEEAISDTTFYGDISTFDTSKVTNMDSLFLNKAVPDISGWDISSVTSMRNMFAGSTGVFDRSTWDLSGKDITNIYAGSDLQSHTLPMGVELQYVDEFVERTSGSCLDNQESEVRPVMSSLECLYAQYDATTTFSSTVTVTNLLPSAGRAGCRYPVAADSHDFTFRPLNIDDLEECTSEIPCLCAKIRPGEYVKADACEGVYEPITSIGECTIAVRHLGEFYGVKDLTDGHCVHTQPVCKMQSYPLCDGTASACIHNGLLCKSGVIIDDTCKIDNEALHDMVQLWNLYPDASLWLYGPLKDWDVHYVTDTTDLFKNMQNDPDITLWDMSNVVHADRMFAGSLFNHPIDNKDFSSLKTATGMLPQGYSHRACGKHFLRAGKGDSSEGFEGHGECLRSEVPEGATKSIIHQAVDDWFDGDRAAVIAKYGHMSEWDVSEVETMQGLFKDRTSIPSLVKWDVSKVTNMVSVFENSDFNEDIRYWDVRKVTDFSSMFKGTTQFAIDLTFWEIHASTNDRMFNGNPHYDGITFLIDEILPEVLTDATFRDALIGWFGSDRAGVTDTYGDISDWLTYQVTDMSEAFKDKQFNGDISRWVVSSVTDMSSMFENSAFNSDISGWEVVNVKNMSSMFKDSPFNQIIDRWNVSNVADMSSMFENTVFSRPIGDWDLFGTEPNEIQAANDDNNWCIGSIGLTVNVDEYNRASLAARRKCFDVCTDLYPVSLPDIEGRNRNRGGGRVGKHYTPYRGGFGMVTNELYNHTCMCADETVECASGVTSPFDYVYDYRDMDTTDMFKGNTKFVQPLCGLGWRYRDITSLGLSQQQVSFTCDICTHGQHMRECGLCLGEFRFDRCMDSPLGFTLSELEELGLTVGEGDEMKVNNFACNCEYEDSMKGCLVVNGRRQVRMTEWYLDGEIDFTDSITDQTQYFCEVDFLNERPVANAVGFNSVICTEDTTLDRFECGLVGGNWDGSCDKCLEPCDPPELGTKFISVDRTCTECPEGTTVFQNECVQCPDGKFTSEDYAYCGKCPQGTYGENGECHTCQDGTASTYEGAIQCQVCGINTYSVGTACLKCAVNEKSEAGSNFCEEARYCWHGDTSVGDEVGNYCTDSCHSNFKHTGTTCVSSCMYGDVVKVANEYRCQCHGKWQGTDCDECPDEFDFTYISPEMCVERTCSDTLVTDCYCSSKIVTGNEFCYEGNIVQKCTAGESACMCDMGDGYEWAPEDTSCIDGNIAKDCEGVNIVPFEPCSNAGYTCKYGLRDNVCTDAFQCEARHFDPGADCCFGGYCSHVTCETTQYRAGGTYVEESECCLERELCSDAGYSCGLRTGYKLKDKPGYVSIRAPTVFQNRGEFDGVCCEEVPYKLHPYSKCANYFAERELTEKECDEYVDIYDQNQGYSAPVIFEGQCIMERTLGGIKSTTVVCIQEV